MPNWTKSQMIHVLNSLIKKTSKGALSKFPSIKIKTLKLKYADLWSSYPTIFVKTHLLLLFLFKHAYKQFLSLVILVIREFRFLNVTTLDFCFGNF